MKIGIVGSRIANGINLGLFEEKIPKNTSAIITGGATGIDSYAEDYANRHDLQLIKHLPDYSLFGKIAPIVRNTLIVKDSDKVIAFWDYKSKGTSHAIKECLRLNVPVEIVNIKDISD